MAETKRKFYRGQMETAKQLFDKAASCVCRSLPMAEAIAELGMEEQAIRNTHSTFRIDNTTFVQLP